MDSPDPDPGEEYPHTNTQLFNMLDRPTACKDATEMVAPFNAPAAGRAPTMDGFVTDYISFFTVELRTAADLRRVQPDHDGLHARSRCRCSARSPAGFGVFDHWFSEVPSQTLANRSFWTAATSSGFVVNRPATKFMRHNTAETIFDRLEQHGRTWKVYVLEPDPISFTGLIHMPASRRFATNFVPFAEFERDAAEGTLPDFSLIEPNLLAGHGDYHPPSAGPCSRASTCPIDPPSSISPGRRSWPGSTTPSGRQRPASGTRTSATPRSSSAGTNPAAPTTTCRPGPVAPPDPGARRRSSASRFDRSGYRVPAVLVSPWVPEGRCSPRSTGTPR